MKMIVLAALAALSAYPVAAQGNCAPRDVVIERLAERYSETRQALGLSQGGVVEVFASETSGSWTITVTLPNGATCLLAAGQAYEAVSEDLPAVGDDL